MTRRWLGVAFICTSAGCEPEKPAVHPVVNLAQFDLSCPRSELRYTVLAENTLGVTGCGKKAKYVRLCRTVDAHHPLLAHEECQWVQN